MPSQRVRMNRMTVVGAEAIAGGGGANSDIEQQVDALESDVAALSSSVTDLEARVEALEAAATGGADAPAAD